MEHNSWAATREEHLYLRIAGVIEHQIAHAVLKIGERLPSVRVLSKEQGVSISTASQAYFHLEAKGLIEARPQSGYYVRFSPRQFPAMPAKSQPLRQPVEANAADIIDDVYADLSDTSLIRFSVGVPAPELLPIAKLNKTMQEALRELPGSGTEYDSLAGNQRLRRQIAKRALLWGGHLTDDEVVTTTGCMNALAFALMALTERGDTIATESPAYFGVLQLAGSLGLRVLELPTDCLTGVDLEALKKALERQKIKACLFVSNFSNPLGACMPDEHKKALVRLLEHHNVPLIEDDLYGDVYFGKSRPRSCKSYDESGLVLWCGSVSKTLAPGYRVGWIAPGRYLEKIKRLKLYHSVAAPTLSQEVIGRFLENGRYEHHLRRMRQMLHANMLQFLRSVCAYFPNETRVCRPGGGFMLWLELPSHIDAFDLYGKALRHGISIAPGHIYSLQGQYRNCMRLCYGLVWEPRIEQALKTLGRLCREV
ncbi:MAG: PLP-dependent aminotransferase family protein [Haliscomenobacteraceae bacterium CHB4]|nr:HTH-type transcriptional regulator NorG [Saprospiraceae bacterium]MCE7921670.1 PLP-dependent aminotransferase family protein [Haliscomenobacteraceae bacterium CHB4]